MVKIFVVTHKENPLLQNNIYQPIQVNSTNNELIYDGILTDATGDNITSKNTNYAELTAGYWITKNYNDSPYVGLCHYRRYFNFYPNLFSFKPSTQKRINSQKFKQSKLYRTSPEQQEKHIVNILKEYDVILPRPYHLRIDDRPISLSENYAIGHKKEDFDMLKQIIIEKYPEYTNSVKKYLEENSAFYVANMCITSKEIWNDFYEWLFSIFFELEQRIEVPKEGYQRRVFGFMGERLTTLYFLHHNYKIKEVPMFKIE